MAAPREPDGAALHAILIAEGELGAQLAEVLAASGLRWVAQAGDAAIVPSADGVYVLGLHDVGQIDRLVRLRAAVPTSAIVVVLAHDPDGLAFDHVLAHAADDCLVAANAPTLLGHVLRRAAASARLRLAHEGECASLHAVFDAGPDPAWVCALPTRRLLVANRAAREAYGCSEAAFRDMHLADLRADPAATEPSPLHDPAAGTIERHRRRDGSDFEVELRTRPLLFEGRRALLVQARALGPWQRLIQDLQSAGHRARALFEYGIGHVCIHDLDGVVVAINRSGAAAFGRAPAALEGRRLCTLLGPSMCRRFEAYLRRIRLRREDSGLLRLHDPGGGERVWQYRSHLFHDGDGSARVVCHAQDITALRAAERALVSGEHRLRTIADALPVRIAYIDPDERLLFTNEACRLAWPGSANRPGVTLREMIGATRHDHYQPWLQRARAGERVVFEYAEGEGDAWRCFEVSFIPETGEGARRVSGIHIMAQDITSTKRERQRLLRLARMDALTGVLNRAGFLERLDNALARARDQHGLLAVFYLDIDHFKQVNDRYGHATGDALIQAFAQRLVEQVRRSDVVARLGGDEFVIMIEGISQVARIERIATAINTAMRQAFGVRGMDASHSFSVSIGVALCRGAPLTAAELLARADAQLYAAKRAGRDAWRMAPLVEADAPASAPAPGH